MSFTSYAIKSIEGRHEGKYYTWGECGGQSWCKLEQCYMLFKTKKDVNYFMEVDNTFRDSSREDKCEIVEVKVSYYKSKY